MTKLQVGVGGVILIAGMATPLLFQHQSLSRMREENNRLREETQSLQQQASQVTQLVAENQRLSNLLARAGSAPSLTPEQRGELLRLRGEATRLRADVQANAKAANPMVEMLKSPEGKEMMKANMRAMGQSVAKSYAKLFADLHLTPEQTAAMKDLIINKTMAGADMITAAMSGQADPAQLQAQTVQVKTEQSAIEDQIKQLLGEANYAQYHTYGKTLSERMVVTQLSDQLADGPKAVRPEQEQQLFDAMVEERQKFAFTTDFSDPSKLKGNVASYYTEVNKQRYLQELEQLSQSYLARAQSILSPDQLAAFQSSLASQQAKQAASVTVVSKLFPPKSAAN
jgi:FtsZ-binding cell division protein ZapB